MRVYEHDAFLPHHPARRRSFCRKKTEAIGTNHGVLDTSTIDASCRGAHAAYFLSQVIEGFADEQSSTTLTKHRSSFCDRCRGGDSGCSLNGDRVRLSFHAPHSSMDWAQIWHRCGPRVFEVEHTSRAAELQLQQKTRSIRRWSWDNRAARQVTIVISFWSHADSEYVRMAV